MLRQEQNLEIALQYIEETIHGNGHLRIGEDCTESGKNGPMTFSMVSARDPIFFRWHLHIENLAQRWRDRYTVRYTRRDLEVTDGLEVTAVSTKLEEVKLPFTNRLLTYMEQKSVELRDHINVKYNRVNYMSFNWTINIRNPNRSRKRVIVRIFIAGLKDPANLKSYEWREAVMMDRFVHGLSGAEQEQVARGSRTNSMSMLESGLTMRRLTDAITRREDVGTWCGLPLNLYLPK
jgi:hypothetical protein